MNNNYLKNTISDSYYFSFYTTYPKGFYQSLKISFQFLITDFQLNFENMPYLDFYMT